MSSWVIEKIAFFLQIWLIEILFEESKENSGGRMNGINQKIK